jgi:hypothetical protein
MVEERLANGLAAFLNQMGKEFIYLEIFELNGEECSME